ncbi:MAG: carboxymuconolactone decarboxylase family protein [Actinomycetota bacterium]|jgi:alkylhydroperoxidase/carboxymuconolactone decarboxylase family protein YurZ|nr:carboxymuconolactone decarboxylase family protein [Actinomycetota bacterium]
MTASTELDAVGRDILRQLFGERSNDPSRPTPPATELAPEFFDLVRQFCYGMFWSRPGLALRDRSLITVAMLAAAGSQDQLASHLRGALNAGVTRDELIEVLMHVGLYAGIPAAVSALTTAAKVLDSI